jgi:hypothetical protein
MTVTRFQLVFRRDGQDDRSEYRYNNGVGEPEIDGRLAVDGGTYVIRGDEWLLRTDDAGDSMSRFVCTLVAESAVMCCPHTGHANLNSLIACSPTISHRAGADNPFFQVTFGMVQSNLGAILRT